ncbi:hypothetical protein LDENG_00198590 [Lucifuga dentata]|nr:hypothetical protein LDENG_00198590 [Lucifuga dentata]
MSVKVESKKKKTLLLPPSFEAVTDLPAALQSSRLTRSVSGSPGRKSCILGGGSRVSEAEKSQQPVRVLDDGGNDVTPRPLYQVEPGAPQAKSSRFFLDEASAATASDLTTTTGSFTAPFPRSFFGSSRISSQSTADSVNEETEDTASKRDVSILPPASHVRGGGGVQEAVTEAVTEAMLQQLVDVCVSETDAVPLLDLHSVSVSEEDRDAEAVRQRNDRHAEVCRKRARVEAYTERSTQTLHQETKNKQVQSGAAATVDAATTASSWDIHDSLLISEQDRSPETETVAGPPDTVDGGGRVARSTSAASSASTGSASGPLRDVEALVLKVDVQLVTLSDRLQHSLAVMERCIMGNVFQPKLAAYRQLPVKTGEPDADRKQREECPAVDRLWTFSCELTRGRNVSSMSCNKKNPDLLAVGYGEFDSGNQKPGLICCWSLKNPTWPERLFHCDGGVTAVDFSEKNPNQLAVGTQDGNVAVYDVQTRNETRVIHSRASPNKHLHPVRQVRWSKQERSLAPEKDETLVSASADGRVSKWFLCNNSLDCIDLMKMRRTRHAQKVKKDEKTENVLSAQIGALCLDFHPMVRLQAYQ